MAVTLPVLGGEGYLTDPDLIMSKVYQEMFLTDYSQSNIFQGDVFSVQYVLSQHGDNVTAIIGSMEKGIKNLFSKYFTGVTVRFQSIPPNTAGQDESSLVFGLEISGDLDGKSYSLSKSLMADNSGSTRTFKELIFT